MTEKILLKDLLFNSSRIERLAKEIFSVYSKFDKKSFVEEVVEKFPELELKARIAWIAICLKKYLPSTYSQAVKILLHALPPPSNPNLLDNDFGEFIYAPYNEYIAQNGCNQEAFEVSMAALHEITKRFSAEDAIRYFINAFPSQTIKELLIWSRDSHYHVRRLCSEGTRPKLPWSQKVNIPVKSAMPILENLFFDPTRFVTRSVANHLNDISKTHPDLVIATLQRWKKTKKQSVQEMDYIIRHALRTLIKQGNSQAMQMLGFSPALKLKLLQFIVPKKVAMNTAIDFSMVFLPQEDAPVVVDYILYFQSKTGSCTNKKVFKLKNIFLKKGQKTTLSKKHKMRQNMTTRTLYPGRHEIALQVNGALLAKRSFEMVLNKRP